MTPQSKGLIGVGYIQKSKLEGDVHAISMAMLWGEGTHNSAHIYLYLLQSHSIHNQPIVLCTLRGNCSKGFQRNNTKIRLVNVCRFTNPNLLLWVHPLQTVAKLVSKTKLNPN